jgi:hypothetical protein
MRIARLQGLAGNDGNTARQTSFFQGFFQAKQWEWHQRHGLQSRGSPFRPLDC